MSSHYLKKCYFSSEKNIQLGIFFPNVDKVAWLAKYPELNKSAASF